MAAARFAAGAGVRPNPSWLQAAWFVDPQNLSGLASDANSGLTALTPVRTFTAGVLARWGTYEPNLRQTTAIEFMSSHTDNTDPVICRPRFFAGGRLDIRGAALGSAGAPLIATGLLSLVTAKVRATNTKLSATLAAAALVGMFLVNTTRNGQCWLRTSLGANAFTLTQPLAPVTIPASVSAPPAEVDTFANGDTFNLYAPVNINLVDLRPSMIDISGVSNANLMQIYRCIGAMPAGTDVLKISPDVDFVECWMPRIVTETGGAISLIPVRYNVYADGQWRGASAAPGIQAQLWAGGFVNAGAFPSGAFFDGDVYLGGACTVGGPLSGMGVAWVDSTLEVRGEFDAKTFANYGANVMSGAGLFVGRGSSRTIYPAGGGGAVAAFRLAGGLQLNGAANGHSVIDGAPDVSNFIATLTAANLDAAAGAAGYGGRAFNYGGASISNGGQ